VSLIGLAIRVEEIAFALERDRREPDKVLCYAQTLRRLALDLGVVDLPPALVAALRDPTIDVPRDHETKMADGRSLWEHLEEWRNAPSNTASAD
jgi:hypothetical protein